MSERVTHLRRRMIEDMRVRNLSATTQVSYVHAVKKFSHHFGRSPADLGLEEVHAYQVHLVRGGIAWATLNQTVSALPFFSGVTLGRKDLPERIPYARRPKTLRVVLSAAEVARLDRGGRGPPTRARETRADVPVDAIPPTGSPGKISGSVSGLDTLVRP